MKLIKNTLDLDEFLDEKFTIYQSIIVALEDILGADSNEYIDCTSKKLPCLLFITGTGSDFEEYEITYIDIVLYYQTWIIDDLKLLKRYLYEIN